MIDDGGDDGGDDGDDDDDDDVPNPSWWESGFPMATFAGKPTLSFITGAALPMSRSNAHSLVYCT